MELAGRKALLTGATGGLGRAIAEALAQQGAELALSARKRDALEEMAAGLPGGGHTVLPADLADPGAAEKLAADAAGTEILIANAGLPGSGLLADFTPEQVIRALRVNLEAPMLIAQALYPSMLERGSGHLVFIASLSGKAGSPRSSIYNATKFGLRGFALGAADRPGPEGRRGLARLAGLHPRTRGCSPRREPKSPPGMGTGRPEQVGAAVVKAIEQEQGRDRRGADAATRPRPLRAGQPGDRGAHAERLGRPEGVQSGRRRPLA